MPRLDPTSLAEHIDALYRAGWALCGSREDAEDLVQETFARVLAQPRTVKAGGDRAYLMSALRHTFYSRLRSASRRPRTVPPPEVETEAEVRTSTLPERAAEVSEIFAAIGRLPEDFRLTIAAVDILGLSYEEAAAALGTREATITSRLYRARQRIAAEFKDAPAIGEHGADSRPGRSGARTPADSGQGTRPDRSMA